MKKAIYVLCRISRILDMILGITFAFFAGYFTLILLIGISFEPSDAVLFYSVFGGIALFFVVFATMCFVSRSLISNLILPRFNAAKWKEVAKNPAIWAIVLGALSAETLLVAGILMLTTPENQLPANSNNQ